MILWFLTIGGEPIFAGNGGSFEKCRRRWDLADNEELKFKFMMAYDRAFNHLDKVGHVGMSREY